MPQSPLDPLLHTQTCVHTHTRTCMCTHAHTQAHAHTHTLGHSCTHTHACTHTHTHRPQTSAELHDLTTVRYSHSAFVRQLTLAALGGGRGWGLSSSCSHSLIRPAAGARYPGTSRLPSIETDHHVSHRAACSLLRTRPSQSPRPRPAQCHPSPGHPGALLCSSCPLGLQQGLWEAPATPLLSPPSLCPAAGRHPRCDPAAL